MDTGTLDPADALTVMIERTPHVDSALAVRRQLHRAAGRQAPELADVVQERMPSLPDQETPPAASSDAARELDERVAAMRARFDHVQGEPQREAPGLDRGSRGEPIKPMHRATGSVGKGAASDPGPSGGISWPRGDCGVPLG